MRTDCCVINHNFSVLFPAEPVVEKALNKAADDVVFVFCVVGDRSR